MVLFFGGIIFALFGVWGCVDLVQKKKKCTEETTAIVTEISKEIDNDNNLSYWPIIEYNINGKKFKNKLLSGNSIFQKYNIGNEVEIFYNKENGDEFYCKERYYSSLFWWLITAIIGGVLMILPFFKIFEEDGENSGSIIMVIIGIILIIEVSKRISNKNELKKRCIEKTIAVVKDIVIDEKKDSDGKININKYPIFQYTVNGKIIEVKSVIGYSTSDYVVGQKVEIFYNPNKEDEIYIEK